jgi:hypothetical protein
MKKTIITVAIMGIFTLVSLGQAAQPTLSVQDNATYQKQSAGIKLKVSVKKKTKNSSIKVSGKTGKYFAVIISVNGQEKVTLTSNKKGAFKAYVPLDSAVNTVSVRAINGTATKTVTKKVKRTGRIIVTPAPAVSTPAVDVVSCLAYNQFKLNIPTFGKMSVSTIEVQRSKNECDLIAQKNVRSKEIVSEYNSTINNLDGWFNNCLLHSQIYTPEECGDISALNKAKALSAIFAAINNLWGTDCKIGY